jgi:translation initiation factor 2 beta subunit (eIF-2beta)/eIF-5
MKKKLLAIGIAFFLSIIQSSTLTQAQTKVESDLDKRIEENYLKLESADFIERYWAAYFFSQLKKEELPQKVMDRAIELFTKEIERLKVFSELLKKPGRVEDNIPKELLEINRSEMHHHYYEYLCKIVGKSGDLRVLPLLVDYHLDSSVLIDFGELAVDPVINVLKTSDNDTRKMSAIFALRDFLKDKEEGYIASGEAREKIKKALVEAVSDKGMWTRAAVVKALGESGDRDFIPVLEKVAESDPYKIERDPIPGVDKDVPPGKKVIRYLIRNDAKKALEKLKEKKN